jgi:hypothetical protein
MIIGVGLIRGRGRQARTLVAPNALAPPLTLTRAQAGGAVSTARSADGVAYAQFAADTPRFNGVSQRLVIEGQRTNSIRNPRGEGGSTPSTLPTNWAVETAAGLTTEFLSSQVINGVDTVTLRISGTASGTSYSLLFESPTQIVAAALQAWAASLHARLDAAPVPPTSHQLRIVPRTAAGAGIAGGITSQTLALTGTLARYTHATSSIGSSVSTARVTADYRAALTSGVAYDWTVTLGWPQIELAASPASTVLSPVGTPGASTRGADLVTATLASLGIGANGAGTYLWSGQIPQAAPTGVNQMLLQIDDSSDANRYRIHNVAGGLTLVGGRTLATVGSDTASLGSMVAGTPFRAGMSIDGAGRAAFSFNGGTALAVTGGPTSGLTTLRLGNNAAGTAAMFGETTAFRVSRRAVTDTELQNLVAGMPI